MSKITLRLVIVLGVATTIVLLSLTQVENATGDDKEVVSEEIPVSSNTPAQVAEYEVWEVFVTGYNSLPAQTDSTPCIGAGGNICGRTDVVACPRSLPLGTIVEIEGARYECMDRLAPKHDNRFDIFCDKDLECPTRVTGNKQVRVLSQ